MGARRHPTHDYVIFSESRGWLNAKQQRDGILVRWVEERDDATWFSSIDHALGRAREIGIELSAVSVLPVPRQR